ncbi:diacylglycerol kinase [Sphingomicrobium marinum]|uniref:diacylglycerol kinase n=1 Tax=Sphingomicrobium marinum TaxID=1227950 RepID=UPI002240A2F0|nr:diacylglycerol kinase family protein [Sphingomicrobium marinum]
MKGLAALWQGEPTTRFHAVGSIAAIAAGWWLGLERWEWAFVVTMIGLVWFAEAVNTSLERLADAVTLEHHPLIGLSKDVASAAVLIISITALLTGLIVFGPYLWTISGN